jgi:hypothetical protein
MAKSKVTLTELATLDTTRRLVRAGRRAKAGVAAQPPTAMSQFLYDDKKDMSVSWPTERIKVRENRVAIASTADMVAMSQYDWICDILKNGQHQRFNDIVADPNYSGPRVVAEGDSWFLHPLIEDTINFLLKGSARVAVWNTACAADTLQTMWDDRRTFMEYWHYIYWQIERPTVMLLSGGGNDLLSDGALYFMLKDYQSGMTPADLIDKPKADQNIATVMGLIKSIKAEINRDFPSIKLLVHGYDYPVPKNDKWIGKPMKKRKIPAGMRRSVVKVFMDLYNDELKKTVSAANYVDLRGIVPLSEWYDEIHPNKAGFKRVAAKIRTAI